MNNRYYNNNIIIDIMCNSTFMVNLHVLLTHFINIPVGLMIKIKKKYIK